jgi:hypothetical protein
MYDGSEYFQNILFKILKKLLLILNHNMYFCHNVPWKIYNPWFTKKIKMLQKVLNVLHDDVHVNQCRITLRLHNIHVIF